MSRLARSLVWILAAGGLAASLASLYVHYQLLASPSYASFCDVSATVSCTQAYLSRYGSFLGVPVALLGAIWFAFAMLLAGLEAAGPRPLREGMVSYLFLASIAALASVLYLAWAAFFVLKVVCLLCLATYVAVIGLLAVSGLAASRRITTVAARIPGDLRALASRPGALAAVLVFAGAAASAVAFFPSEEDLRATAVQQAAVQSAPPPAPGLTDQFTRWWEAQPRVPVPVPADGAAVVVVKFTDIQCPFCGTTHFALKPILAKYQARYPGAVKYVVRDYPLQPECNPAITRPYHLAACEGAAAIRLAGHTGRGEALEDWLYANQLSLSPAAVRQAAAEIGGVKEFDAGYAGAIAAVRDDVSLGQALQVRVTPTFYVNGVKAEDAGQPIAPQFLDLAIGLELKKAGVAK